MSKLDVASRAPTPDRAVWFIDSDVTPRPMSTHASNGSAAPAADADGLAGGGRRLADQGDQAQQRGLPRVVQRGHAAQLAVGGENVLGQVVGADRDEVDDLQDLACRQGGGRDLDHHAGALDACGAGAFDEPGGFGGGGDHRGHDRDVGT